MKTHVQIVAILHIAMGALSLLGAIAVFAFFGVAGGIVLSQGEHQAGGLIGMVAIALGGFLTVISLPGVIGGWALLAGRFWGRIVVLVLSALHIFNFPLGTALGIYTFWALLREPSSQSSGNVPIRPIA